MSYNTIASAKALTSVDLTQELLDEAQSYVHENTMYRWEATTVTDVLSSKDYRGFPGQAGRYIRSLPADDVSILLPRTELSIFLKMPIVSITTFTIDGTSLVDGTDYEMRADIGEVRLTSFAFIGSASLTGVGDISITYIYGFTSATDTFPMVRGIEARIALLLKNNPLLLPSISLQGDAVNYGAELLDKILHRLPRPFGMKAITR
ncbi:MAG: hypothetical protein Q7J73_00650 [Dehalococcoidales bacterium]|nr:hypothetical protein [Dehalococcoidales bacterium]